MEPQQTPTPNLQSKEDIVKPVRKIRGQKTKELIKKLPQQKPHLEFISALLSIPVLITVLLLNLNNLSPKKGTPATTPTPSVTITAIVPTSSAKQMQFSAPASQGEVLSTPQATESTTPCTQGIGPIDISYPQEGQSVNDNPLCITIDYTSGSYCGVVWSYKINSSSWSDYGNNAVCLYNLPNGNTSFSLRVKSLTGPDTKTLDRNFIYAGAQPTGTPVPSPTPSISSLPTGMISPTPGGH